MADRHYLRIDRVRRPGERLAALRLAIHDARPRARAYRRRLGDDPAKAIRGWIWSDSAAVG
ncbi:MAG: hypothetical protein ACLP8S_14600 [Solirubrobacteraceae bacterium]